jgi:hypothetical protein
MYKRPELRRYKQGSFLYTGESHPYLKSDSDVVQWTRKFIPVANWESYLRLMALDGMGEEELAHLKTLHERPKIQPQIPVKNKEYNTKPVIVKMKVTGDGVRLVVVENKLASMLRKYCSMGKMAPQKVWIEAWVQAGVDFKDVLAGIVRRNARKNEDLPKCLSFATAADAAVVKKVKKVLKPVVKLT